MKKTKHTFTLKWGVFVLGVATLVRAADQSEASVENDPPMSVKAPMPGQTGMESPEVVLQLKYGGGELNRIYLAQFRKGKRSRAKAVPAVPKLCSDLCHAGLGGEACGDTCEGLLPVSLQAVLNNSTESGPRMGAPRIEVCPSLCANGLGNPLCNCNEDFPLALGATSDWNAICNTFCLSDNYNLSGCPQCGEEVSSSLAPTSLASSRILSTAKGWQAWCGVQCPQGTGGAACNCDKAPFL